MSGVRVLIISPIRQTPEILQAFLTSLVGLERTDLQVDYLFFDDNADLASSLLLQSFYEQHPTNTRLLCASSRSDQGAAHEWTESSVWHVASMKDMALELALADEYEGALLVDSDLVLHPKTLLQLLASHCEIVSEIFWTRWHEQGPEYPQVWLADRYRLHEQTRDEVLTEQEIAQRTHHFLQQLRQPGLYEVGGLGACTLIRRRALQAGVRFAEIPNLSFIGEDRHFCIRAAALGFKLFVDTQYPAYHIYRKGDLAGVAEYQRRCQGLQGITVSLCLIVKNEEDTLGRCLSSVQSLVDEIIVVDTGSTDKTREVADRFGVRWYEYEWHDHFAAARNFAFSKATQDYIMWLDADDVVEEPDRIKLRELIDGLDRSIDYVSMPYHLAFDESENVSFSVRRNRLVRRDCAFQWIGFVHEFLQVGGNGLHSEVVVKHMKIKTWSDRNLRIYQRQEADGVPLTPRDLYYYGNELKDNAQYENAIEKYEAFLSTRAGWREDVIAACMSIADCYGALQEREQQLKALLRTFEYDTPRAECCCRLGWWYLQAEQVEQAIYWYETATQLSKPKGQTGFLDLTCWTWVPHLQLCVCYDRLGEYQKAFEHNEKASSYHPKHPAVLNNREYLQNRLSSSTDTERSVCQ